MPGNHDLVPEMRAALDGAPFVLDGPADIGAWRFVLLDSVIPNQAGGHISVEMLSKLDEDLGRARQRHSMVVLNHHPVAMSSRWLDKVGLANANEFWSVVDSHPQVRAVVWGHVHQPFEGVRRGVLIAESVHPNSDHLGGKGINVLTGAEAVAPIGGAAFHDNKVWIRKAAISG